MSLEPTQLGRVSNLMQASISSSNISRTQQQLLDVQNQLSTGKRLSAPSDDPISAAVAQQLHKALEQRQAYVQNLQQGQTQLSQADSALQNLTDLLRQASSIASKDVGADASPTQRTNDADVIKTIYAQALNIANTQFNGVYVFGGDSGAAPYVEANGGVQFVGSTTVLQNAYGDGLSQAFQISGADVFGGFSAPTGTAADLGPITPTTQLSTLFAGAGLDVSGGLKITNGANSATIDFTGCNTIGDVIDRVNSANIGAVAQINSSGNGIEIVSNSQGTNLTVGENTGTLGATLGVLTSAPVAASGIFGALLNLQSALQANDSSAITAAAGDLQDQTDNVIRRNGQVGAMIQQMSSQQDHLDDQNVATQALLSDAEDTDFTSAISQFQLLQNSLQATLQTTARTINLSLMDFLS